MSLKRIVLFMIIFLLVPLALIAEVDFVSGNIRIIVDDYDGSISLYRKINSIDELTKKKDNSSTTVTTGVIQDELIEPKTGASGTKFGLLPESSYSIDLQNKKNENTIINWKPLLDTSRYSSGSAYYLLFNSEVFKLTRNALIQINSTVEPLENNVYINFVLKDKAKVSIVMHVFSSDSTKDCDSIRVEVITKNLTNKRARVAVKGVFDTYLGENNTSHFTTANYDVIDSEINFETMSDAKWISSQNSIAGIKFVLTGATISQPDNVILANKDFLSSKDWVPSTRLGRSFDSLFCYNNSAISVIWNKVNLSELKQFSLKFYITTGENEENPSDLFTNSEYLNSNLDSMPQTSSKLIEKPMLPEEPEVLDADYVQLLLRYIKILEDNPQFAEPDEIEYLNTEVEKILQQLGQ